MKKELRPSTVLVPCPVVLLSVAGEEKPNIITLSWAANICSSPPAVAIGIRPSRQSHKMVKDVGDFVLSISRANNNSNLPIYVYDRNQFSVTLNKAF